MRPTAKGQKLFLLWSAFAVPLLAYAWMVWKFAVDVPVLDDYDAALGFLNAFIGTSGFRAKAALILSQHNEHRIVLDRLVFLGQYLILGKIDFRISILIGNMGWVLAALLILGYL